MKVCVIIPVFNEQDFIKKSVESLIDQTIKPAEVIYVNDNSTDNSKNIIKNLIGKCEWIRVIDHKSFQEHVPGSKVIEAFNFGLKNLETQFDIICKFDGDIILPKNYIEKIIEIFNEKEKVGIAGGNLYVLKNGKWIYENIAAKTHVRGPIKAYRAECFNDINALKSSIGWDTVDVLLAQKKGWLIYTDKNLIVNLGTGEGHSVMDVINMACEVSGKKIEYSFADRRAGDPNIVIAGSNKAKKLINWNPKHSDLFTIINSTWNIYNQ